MGSLSIKAKALVQGRATGEALVSPEPLSFWGGYDYRTGTIIDARHPLAGRRAAGRVLIFPFTRGSSTTTAVLLEAIKAGTAPAALVSNKVDAFLCLAAIVADEMYGRSCPVLAVEGEAFHRFEDGQHIEIRTDGTLRIETIASVNESEEGGNS